MNLVWCCKFAVVVGVVKDEEEEKEEEEVEGDKITKIKRTVSTRFCVV